MKGVKWIRTFLKPFRNMYMLALLLLLISIVTNLLMTGIQKFLVDNVFVKGEYDQFGRFLLLFGIIAAAYLASWVAKDMLFERVDSKLKISLRKHALEHIHRVPAKVYHKERVGKLSSDLDAFVNSSQILTYKLPGGIENSLNLVLLAALVGYANWMILAAVSVFGVAYVWLGKRFLPRTKKAAHALQEQRSEMNVDLEEGISSTREVIAFHREAWERRKMETAFSKFFEKALYENKIKNLQLLWTDPLKWGATLIVLGLGGYGVMHGNLSLGMFVIVYQFTSQLLDSFNGVYQTIQGLGESVVSVERAGRWLNEGSYEASGWRKMDGPVESLFFQDVHFGYSEDREQVLNGLDANMPIGGKIAFVGESGGGKSTIAQLLIRFYDPDRGRLFVNGIPLDEIHRQDWMARISIVFQEPYLFPDSIRTNLLLGRSFTDAEMHEACKTAQIHETIMAMPRGYDTVLGERGITLSGGQRQRLAIARSILGDPEILILDEATSALDLETERKLMADLDAARAGRTTIVIAHRLSTVENADMIFVMDNGRVEEYGSHDRLIQKDGTYRRLVIGANPVFI